LWAPDLWYHSVVDGRILAYLHNKDQQDALFFLISIIYPLHVSNKVTVHNQEAFTVYATYGIDHAESILILCKITYIYIVTKSIKYKVEFYLEKGGKEVPPKC
jgi:hypothetical protein